MKKAKINQNNCKKRLGNLVTGILHSFGDSSVENLTQCVRNLSSKPMDYIHTAVRRTLHNGLRFGFIIKQNHKYSLSSRTQETDISFEAFDEVLGKCEQANADRGCHESPNKCDGLDLITLGPCNRDRQRKRGFCVFHN